MVGRGCRLPQTQRCSVVVSFLFRFEAVLSGGSGGFPYFVAYVFPFVSSVRKVGQ